MAKKKYSKEFEANKGRIRRLSTEEQRKIAKKGSDAHAEKCKRERNFIEDLKIVLKGKMLPAMQNVHSTMELPEDTKDTRMGLVMGLVRKAMSGDVAAQKMIWDALKEYTETQNINVSGLPETPVGDRLFTKKDKE